MSMASRKRNHEDEKRAEKKKPKVTKLHGLINQGGTCYLNSVLQVLYRTPGVHGRLDPRRQKVDRELRSLFNTLAERRCGTENITRSLHITDVHEQRDAAECLEQILQQVSQQVSELFTGALTLTTKCVKEHLIIQETNPFFTLPLSLKDAADTNFSVETGFESTFQEKTFSSGNMMFCTECEKKTAATSRCQMVVYPPVLVLLLKRFDFDLSTMSHVKSNRAADVPRTLRRKNRKYELYGIVNHMGSLRGGHYTATIASGDDDAWYEFDDAHVRKVKDQLFTRSPTLSSRTAYLLIYRGTIPHHASPPSSGLRQDNGGHRPGRKDADEEENGLLKPLYGDDGRRDAREKVPPGEDELRWGKQTGEQRSDGRPEMKQRGRKEEETTCSPSCRPDDIKKNRLWFGLVVAAVILLIVVLSVVLTRGN